MRILEEILGSSAAAKSFARFWEKNGDDLQKVSKETLLNLAEDPNADLPKAELAMWKKGQADIVNVFKNAWVESQEK